MILIFYFIYWKAEGTGRIMVIEYKIDTAIRFQPWTGLFAFKKALMLFENK